MLRRLSDVTIGSIEKLLKIGGKEDEYDEMDESEKKRKFTLSECEEEENMIARKENYRSRLVKSKGYWDLSTDPVSNSSENDDNDISVSVSVSDDVESLVIDLENVDSSEIPSDLSINEEEWTDYLNMEQLNTCDDILTNVPSSIFDFDEIVYWNEIYKIMKLREGRGKVVSKAELLRNHPDLSHVMRTKLINWLFEVAFHYKLQKETIYSTQILLDSFLSITKTSFPRTKLQLIGLACLLISAKLEEVRPPNLSDLSIICDEMFSKREIAAMELEICSTLKWSLTPINCLTWLRFYENNLKRIIGGEFCCEGKLDFLIHSSRILDFSSSKISAALLAEIFPDHLMIEKCTGYKITELEEEIQWTKSWQITKESGSIAYVYPKELKLITDDQFDEMIRNHRKSLNFILKKMK